MWGENGEDLLHFMALCPKLQDLRKLSLFGNVRKSKWLTLIMGLKDYGTMRKIAKYIKSGMIHRGRFSARGATCEGCGELQQYA